MRSTNTTRVGVRIGLGGLLAASVAAGAVGPVAASHAATRSGTTTPTPGTVSVANDGPVGVPAGDYLLTASVSAVSGTAQVIIVQSEGGTGPWERTADNHVNTASSTVSADVRLTGPSDVLDVLGYTPIKVSNLQLAPATWGYLSRGPKITSPTSPSVVWHGVNGNPDWPVATMVNDLKTTTAANIVRVPVYEEKWLPFFTAAYVSGYRQTVINTVNSITAGGMTAIIDLHIAGHDAPKFNPGYAQSAQLGPDQHSLAFWQDAASLWANNPSVIFEAFNEPQIIVANTYYGQSGASVWRNGGWLTGDGYTWLAPGMQQVVNTIRATGAKNLVLVDGPDWAGNLLPVASNPIDGTNLAYAFHAYTQPGEDPTTVPAHLLYNVGPMIGTAGAYQYAAVATEFGTIHQDTSSGSTGSAYLASTAQWIASKGAGWLVWGWYPMTYDAFGMLGNWPMVLTSRAQTVVAQM